jgi:hypothetical protein
VLSVLLVGFDKADASRTSALATAVTSWLKENRVVSGQMIFNASVFRKTVLSGNRHIVTFARLFAPVENLG